MSANADSRNTEELRNCVLSPDRTPTIDAVYDCLSADLQFPSHFGRNLDALYDCLTGDAPGPFRITVRQPGQMQDLLGSAWDELAVLLVDLVTEREDVTVSFTNG